MPAPPRREDWALSGEVLDGWEQRGQLPLFIYHDSSDGKRERKKKKGKKNGRSIVLIQSLGLSSIVNRLYLMAGLC